MLSGSSKKSTQSFLCHHLLYAYLNGSSVVMPGQSLVMRDPGEENEEQ